MEGTRPGGRVETDRRATGRSWRRTAGLLTVAAAVTLSACGSSLAGSAAVRVRAPADPIGAASPPVDGGTPGLPAFYRTPSPLSPAPPGSIIRSEVVAGAGRVAPGATAYRVLYHSETIDGADIGVSGLVVVPGGAPPVDGFPIMSWAHGTTGLADPCAPSLGTLGSIPDLAWYLDHRMIVAATDYQGLGTPGSHPYLVGQSEAQDVLDAARAARNLVGTDASNTVVIVGYSQGGQAALFAGQITQTYAPELYLAGIVAVGPETSVSELAPTVPSGAPDADGAFAAMALYAWSQTYGNLPLAAVFTGRGLADSSLIPSACVSSVGAVYDAVPTGLLFRSGWSSDPAVRTDDVLNQAGHAPISAPVLVVQGTDDALIPDADTTALVDGSLCRSQHDLVRYVPIPGASHAGALSEGAPTIQDWVTRRLAGIPETGSCPR